MNFVSYDNLMKIAQSVGGGSGSGASSLTPTERQAIIDAFGSSSSGGGVTVDTLWENTAQNPLNVNDILTLSHDYTKYDYIMMEKHGNGYHTLFIPVNRLLYLGHTFPIANVHGGGAYTINFIANSNTSLKVSSVTDNTSVIGFIRGFKFSSSSSSGGSGTTITELWSGTYSSVNAGDTLTLSDSYTNYDEIIFLSNGAIVSTLFPSEGSNIYSCVTSKSASNVDSEVQLAFSGNTVTAQIWNYGVYISSLAVKIVGRNYGSSSSSGGGAVTRNVLWEGSAYTDNDVLTLSNNYADYDYIIAYINSGIGEVAANTIMPKGNNQLKLQTVSNTVNRVCWIVFTSNTTATLSDVNNLSYNWYVSKIEGIKYN